MRRSRGRPWRAREAPADVRLEVRLTQDERARLLALAHRLGVSVSDVVRVALRRDFCPDVIRDRTC